MLEYKWNGKYSYYLKDGNRLGSKAMSKILMNSLNKLFHRFDKNKALAIWSDAITIDIASKSILGSMIPDRADIFKTSDTIVGMSVDHSKTKYDTSLLNEIDYTAYSEPITIMNPDFDKLITNFHQIALSDFIASKIREHFLSNKEHELLMLGIPKYIIGDIYSRLDSNQQCFIIDINNENKMFKVGLSDNNGVRSYVDENIYNNPIEGLIAILEKLNTKLKIIKRM